jgi:hypothetical protein
MPIPGNHFIVLLLGITLFSCRHNGKIQVGNVDLDQEVTTNRFPMDSVFLHFEKNWKKFINSSLELQKPVLQEAVSGWAPIVISNCIYSPELGHNIPVVELSWNESPAQRVPTEEKQLNQEVTQARNVRFDISLHYKGFERNYYTTAFPATKEERFNIPMASAFIKDTAAVMLTGPTMLPKIAEFKQVMVRVNETDMLKKTLKLTELGPGTSYRIRICRYNGQSWAPSSEFIFSTPICPLGRD